MEMVDTQHIIKFIATLHTFYPPVILCFFHGCPVVNWISPKLSCGGKSIWFASCNMCWLQLFIHEEGLWVRPSICTVEGNKKWNVTNDFYIFLACIRMQFFPMYRKFILLELEKCNGVCKICASLFKSICLACAVSIFPLLPRCTLIFFFECHI